MAVVLMVRYEVFVFGSPSSLWEHLTYAMSINTYSSQKLENLQLDHKEK
ncbi:hypothetical protein MiTa_04195 [Microcystis aeruginosa NIES-4264]|nr:hypothetical protein MiTa_04195 [Microcystis aeruginosa NIES-4264]